MHHMRGQFFQGGLGDLNLVEINKGQVKPVGQRAHDRDLINYTQIDKNLAQALSLTLLLGRERCFDLSLSDKTFPDQYLAEPQPSAGLCTAVRDS
jgi:hypothetical protein